MGRKHAPRRRWNLDEDEFEEWDEDQDEDY